MIVQVGRLGVQVAPDAVLDEAQARFARERCVLLPGFVTPDLLHSLQSQLAAAPFAPFVHRAVGAHVSEFVLADERLLGRLQFLFNDQRLFDAIARVTGCAGIACYAARVYRMVPGEGHHDDWHDDLEEEGAPLQRLAAMSVNLSDGIYEGGILQIVDRVENRMVHEVANTGFGDAIVFALSDRLKHRVTDVGGATTKTALAGWFQTAPAYRELVHAANPVSAM